MSTTLASVDVFELQRVICRNKIANFNLAYVHLAPTLGATPSEFCRYLQHQKTRVTGLSCGVSRVIIRLVVSIERRLGTL